MWCPRGLVIFIIVVCQGILHVFANSDDKAVYVVHYRQGRSIVPVTIEIDFKQKTEYVFNLRPKSSGKSVTFYDFREGIVAYKYLILDQCFISHFTEETLEAGTKILQKLENKVVNESSLVTLWASNRALPPKLLFRLAGKRIAEFCKNSASFLVTSSENNGPLKLRRKRDTAAEEKQQKGQFTHRSYGHYGHQSHNYAHYGHETYTGGQSSSAGESMQKIEQYQTRRDGHPLIPSAGALIPPGSSRYVDGPGADSSEGFALRTGYEGGYQINQPFGLRAGSHYRGGLSTQGQYGTSSRTLQPGASTSFSQIPGLVSRGDTTPGIPVGSGTSITMPGMLSRPSTRPTDVKTSYQDPRDLRRDAQPGFPSSGIVSPRDPFLTSRVPGLSGYPATTVTHPGRSFDTVQPEHHIRTQQPCCQQKTEGPTAVSPDVSRIPTDSRILQPGYRSPGTGMIQPGYPTTGIPQALDPLNGIKPPDYRPSAIVRPPAYPSPGILTPTHRIPQTTHPGILPPQTDDSLFAITRGQAPCCQPKIQQPGIITTEGGIPPARDIRIQPARPPSPYLGYPSAIITPPGYPHPTTIQPSYPSSGEVPCCQPKVQPPGTVTTAADFPAVRDVRYTETRATHFDHQPSQMRPQSQYPYSVILQPDHPSSGVAAQPSHTLPIAAGHPSHHTGQQVYPLPPTPGAPPCCQPKVQQPESAFIGAPSVPGRDQMQIRRPDHTHPSWKYPGYPLSTGPLLPDQPSSLQQPAYPSPSALQPGFPLQGTDAGVAQPGYLLYPGQQQPEHRPLVSPQSTYVPSPGISHAAYPYRDVQYPAYPTLGSPGQTYRLPGAPQPSTGIIPPDSIFPGSQPGYLPPRTIYPVQPGYSAQPRGTAPDYQPPETAGARVAHAEHLLPRTPGTYPPGTLLPSVRTFVPGSPHSVTGPGILAPPGQIEHSRNGLTSVRSKDDTAVSQTQVQTGYEGTAAEATSIGRQGGLGAQTQVQGGYTGNGSFSAQAQSGFTGGVTQSQVRGGKQGGLSGSSAQVERVGSAQSQVQVGRPSGAATGTAQGRFLSGVTQVQAQSGKAGGSAGAQAQSMGTSNSQVQVNVADGQGQSENGFQGGVSASVSGGYFGGQAHTQLQGGYDSGRTYVATAQGGFDSTSEFRGSVPGIGTIPGMLVRPLNGRLQPPTGAAGAEYVQPSITRVPGLPQDHISRPADHLRFRPSEADRVYQRDYRFPNGSIRIPVNGIRDQTGISRATEESRRLYVPSASQLSGDGMSSIPGPVDITGLGQQTHLRYPGIDEGARRSFIPSVPSTPYIPAEPSQPVQLNGMAERAVFRPAHPGFIPTGPLAPGVFSPSGQRLDTEFRLEGIPTSTGPQLSTRIPGISVTDTPGSMPVSVDFTGKRRMPNGHVPDLLHPDRTTQEHRVWPSHPSAQFPYDQQQIRPPQETVRPLPHVPTAVQPVDSPVTTESRNISRDAGRHLPLTTPQTPFPTTSGDSVPDCCKPKRDWRTRCCQSRKFQQNGGARPQCCSSKYPDEDDEKYSDDDSDFDDDAEDGKDSCRIVKAVCYIVYKPSGRARVCKPTGTRGCR